MRAVMADNAAEEMAGDMKSFNGSQLDFHDRPYNHILDHNPALKYFFVVCLALQTTFGTLGNILVIGAVIAVDALRNTGNAFIVNLAIADMLVTALTQPANILGALYGEEYFRTRRIYCSVISTFCATGCLSSCWNMCMIAVNRFVLICKYEYYGKIYTKRNTALMCGFVWITIYAIHLPNHVGWGDLRFSRTYFTCTFANHVHSYAIFYIMLGVMTPLTISFFAYLNIYLKVKDSKLTRNRILNPDSTTITSVAESTNSTNSASAQISSVAQKFYDDVKIIRVMFRVWVIYIMMWLPLVTLILAGQPDKVHYGFYIAALLVAHGNSSINCLVYAASIEQFRQGYQKVMGFNQKKQRIPSKRYPKTGGRKLMKDNHLMVSRDLQGNSVSSSDKLLARSSTTNSDFNTKLTMTTS